MNKRRRVPTEDVEAYLRSLNDDLGRVFTIGRLVAYWHNGCGVMLEMEDDAVFSEACCAYLRRNDALHFESSIEAEDYAKSAGWLTHAAQQ